MPCASWVRGVIVPTNGFRSKHISVTGSLSLSYILCLNVFFGAPMICSLFSIVSYQRWLEQIKNHSLILPLYVVRDHVAEWIGRRTVNADYFG